jgi:hypothetical protein
MHRRKVVAMMLKFHAVQCIAPYSADPLARPKSAKIESDYHHIARVFIYLLVDASLNATTNLNKGASEAISFGTVLTIIADWG